MFGSPLIFCESIMFKQIENAPLGSEFDSAELLRNLKFTEDGLVPAIAQQFDSKEVLMMAWMNAESLRETLSTGRVCYWSRSRQKLWRKGEESGQVQLLKSLHLDCDGDTVLLLVDQTGPACHTGRRNCFFFKMDADKTVVDAAPIVSPEQLYKK